MGQLEGSLQEKIKQLNILAVEMGCDLHLIKLTESIYSSFIADNLEQPLATSSCLPL